MWETRAKRRATRKKEGKKKNKEGNKERNIYIFFVLIPTQSHVKWTRDLALHLRAEEQSEVCMLGLKLITDTAASLSLDCERMSTFAFVWREKLILKIEREKEERQGKGDKEGAIVCTWPMWCVNIRRCCKVQYDITGWQLEIQTDSRCIKKGKSSF